MILSRHQMHLRICALNAFHSMIWKRIWNLFFFSFTFFSQPKMSHGNVAMRHFYLRLCVTQKFVFFSHLCQMMMTYTVAQPPANYSIVYICFSVSGIFMVAFVVKHTIFYGFTHVCWESIAGCLGNLFENEKNIVRWRCLRCMKFSSHTLSFIGLGDILAGMFHSCRNHTVRMFFSWLSAAFKIRIIVIISVLSSICYNQLSPLKATTNLW